MKTKKPAREISPYLWIGYALILPLGSSVPAFLNPLAKVMVIGLSLLMIFLNTLTIIGVTQSLKNPKHPMFTAVTRRPKFLLISVSLIADFIFVLACLFLRMELWFLFILIALKWLTNIKLLSIRYTMSKRIQKQ